MRDQVVIIAVQDGLAAEIDHGERKFYRGRQAGSGGSGLGLAIANRIVSDHRGQFVIDSVVGTGTTVSLTLHVAEQHDEETHSHR